jgi:integrase
MHLFKPVIVRYIGPGGRRVPKGTAGARKVRLRARKWYGEYRDAEGRLRRVPLASDKQAAHQLLARCVKEAERGQAGMIDPFGEQRCRPLKGHVEDYQRYLSGKGDCPDHITLTIARIRRTLDGCEFKCIGDINPGGVIEWLAEVRKATGAAHTERKSISIATRNGYLTALKGFCRWLVNDGRTGHDPIVHVARLNPKPDIRRERRALLPDEFACLLHTTRPSANEFRGLTGEDRYMLYATAVGTGLRASELASLTPALFDLDTGLPVVHVKAAYTKNRDDATQPLAPVLAKALRLYLAGKPPGRPVWPGTWVERAAVMFRKDLAAARLEWIANANSEEQQRTRRENADFLSYQDKQEQVLDFHALRHSFITMLARGGIHPKVAQTLARHSTITLTMDRYAHVALSDRAAAVECLPLTFPMQGNANQLAAESQQVQVGEIDMRVVAPGVAVPAGIPGQEMALRDAGRQLVATSANECNSCSEGSLSGVKQPLTLPDARVREGTRTPNPQIHNLPNSTSKSRPPGALQQPEAAGCTPGCTSKADHELVQVVNAWPRLADHIKATILTLIAACGTTIGQRNDKERQVAEDRP